MGTPCAYWAAFIYAMLVQHVLPISRDSISIVLVLTILPILLLAFFGFGWQMYQVHAYAHRLRAVAKAPGGNGSWSIVPQWKLFDLCSNHYSVGIGNLAIRAIWRADQELPAVVGAGTVGT